MSRGLRWRIFETRYLFDTRYRENMVEFRILEAEWEVWAYVQELAVFAGVLLEAP